ncbi:glycosyltransferase [Candidatus Haliotispira prima]|uniref:UDP-N-acetylglucosamine--N-acetylmuramyl-(pentapeptide) pyrophosphoryl-undecaprenol N-acetylglucosamine transferase n=1 Tax=Candidatus Haliotispira prima TaxID=3034016 RepID=A0ABY8MDL5_9SPIO|nr:glycosyltransferase [Candidatus Haliotispira prima]
MSRKGTKQPTNHNTAGYCIALSGGGTGGHVYPALAMLQRLEQRLSQTQPDTVLEVLWLGGHNGIEKDIVAQQALRFSRLKIEYCGISCGKLRRYFSWQNCSDLLRTLLGIRQSYHILRRKRPALLFSKGGFVTVPGIIAAKLLNIPSLAHESDLDPGLATRLALPFLETLFLPYEQSRKYYKAKYQAKLEVSGNPVRAEFFARQAAQQSGSEQDTVTQSPAVQTTTQTPIQAAVESRLLPADWLNANGRLHRPLLLVLGGSLGAHELNTYVKHWLRNDKTTIPESLYILHQCGKQQHQELRHLEKQHSHYRVHDFISDGLDAAYRLCRESGGLVLSRAGAGALWEILVSENRSILVPLQSGTRGDQLRNARLFTEQGRAQSFITTQSTEDTDKQRNSENLLEQIQLILQDGASSACPWSPVPQSAQQIPDAALHIAQRIWQRLQQTH